MSLLTAQVKLPSSVNAARALIASVLSDREKIDVLKRVPLRVFPDFQTRTIAEVMLDQEADGKSPRDLAMLEARLGPHTFQEIGGYNGLSEILNIFHDPDLADDYADEMLRVDKVRELAREKLAEIRRLDETTTVTAGANPQIYGSTGLAAWLGTDEPTEDDGAAWLVQGMVPKAVPWVIVGPPKSCKTWMAEHLAICIASGAAFLGIPVQQGRVLLLPREDSTLETRRRIWRLCRGLGIDPRTLDGRLIVETQPFYLDRQEDVARMHASIDAHGVDVVLVDSLSRSHTADENSVSEMRPAIAAWSDLAMTRGVSFGLIHHMGKGLEGRGVGQRMRGTSDLHAMVRHVLAVELQTDGTSKVSTSGNLPGQPEPFAVRLVDGFDDNGKKCIRLEHAGKIGETSNDEMDLRIIEALEAGPLTARDLRKAVRGKGVVKDARVRFLRVERRIRLNDDGKLELNKEIR
jgi:hypothetical protein